MPRRSSRPSERQPFNHSDCVYFGRRPEDGLIKIGTTRFLRDRIPALKNEHPGFHVFAVLSGDRQREAEIHAQFAAFHKEGEWFSPSPQLDEFISTQAEPYGAGHPLPTFLQGSWQDYRSVKVNLHKEVKKAIVLMAIDDDVSFDVILHEILCKVIGRGDLI